MVLWSWFKSSTALNRRNLLPSLPVVAQIAWNIGFALQKFFDAWAVLPLHCTTPVKPPGIAQPGALTCQLPPLLSIPKTLGANSSRLFLLGYSSFFPPEGSFVCKLPRNSQSRGAGIVKVHADPWSSCQKHTWSLSSVQKTHVEHAQSVRQSAHLEFSRHLLIRILIKALGDIPCLELCCCPVGMRKSSELLEPRPLSWREKCNNQGWKVKFCGSAKRIKPCQNQFLDN